MSTPIVYIGYLFPGDDAIAVAFAEFDAKHPEVYTLFRRFACELLDAGCAHGSADMICHRIRWETAVNPEWDHGFKVNNNFTAMYARKLMAEDARFAQFFRTRERRTA